MTRAGPQDGDVHSSGEGQRVDPQGATEREPGPRDPDEGRRHAAASCRALAQR